MHQLKTPLCVFCSLTIYHIILGTYIKTLTEPMAAPEHRRLLIEGPQAGPLPGSTAHIMIF